MEQMQVCPKCGNPVPEGASQCPHCGYGLTGVRGRDEEPLVGTMVGEYRIVGILREGGMGLVYEAIHPVIGKKAVVKVLRGEMARDEEAVARFLWEARAVNTIGHPNIVDVFSFGRLDDGAPYMIMERLEGITLHQYLEDHGVVDYEMAHRVLGQIISALKAAHDSGIVHRDLKPDNVFLVDRPDGMCVKLLDFGIAKFVGNRPADIRTRTGMPMGTPHFMSPEQCAGRRDVDHRADIYSLGVMMYRMFTGVYPFHSDSYVAVMNAHLFKEPPPPSLISDVPAELEKIILWCMEKKPDARPQDVAELRERLMPVLESLSEGGGVPSVRKDAAGLTQVSPEEFEDMRPEVSFGWLRYTVAGTFLFFLAVLGILAWRSFRSDRVVRIPVPQPNRAAVSGSTESKSEYRQNRKDSTKQLPPSAVLKSGTSDSSEVQIVRRIPISVTPADVNALITVDGSATVDGSSLVITGSDPIRVRVQARGYEPWTGKVDASVSSLQVSLMAKPRPAVPMKSRPVRSMRQHRLRSTTSRHHVRKKSPSPMNMTAPSPMVDGFL